MVSGTSIEASTNTSELAQKPSWLQMTLTLCHSLVPTRIRPIVPKTRPAATTATTPETWR